MESKTRTAGAGRQRTARRQARRRNGTSCGQPVPVGFYLNPMRNETGGVNREMIVERFQTESYG